MVGRQSYKRTTAPKAVCRILPTSSPLTWAKAIGVWLACFLLLGPVWLTATSAQDSVITIVTPPDQLIIGRNPATVSGTVSDPSITTVYAIRVGAPVVILVAWDKFPGVQAVAT